MWTSRRRRAYRQRRRKSSAPVILSIDVMPESLTPADGLTVALQCKMYLEQEGITDGHVELRESDLVGRSQVPRFPLNHGLHCRGLQASYLHARSQHLYQVYGLG